MTMAIVVETVSEAVRKTLYFAFVENSLRPTTTPVQIVQMADGSEQWAALGYFVNGDDAEVYTRCIVSKASEVEVLSAVKP